MSDTILTDKTLESKSQEDDENENKNENVNENENENLNKNDETLMSSNEDKDDDEIIKILMQSHEYAKTTNQNDKNIAIKKLNDHFDKLIDKSKSLEDQIESLEKVENLDEYYFMNDFDDKELKSKIFKLKLAHLLKIIDKKLFETIFGHTIETLANKLINTSNKEKNQIIVNSVNKNKDKLYEQDEFNDWGIQPSASRIDLIGAIDFVLDFNEEAIQLDLVWKYKNYKMSE